MEEQKELTGKKGTDGLKERKARKKADKPKKIRLHSVTLESDIKYRGPLSSREFKIFGWLCIVLGQALVMMKLGGRVNAGLAQKFAGTYNFLDTVANMALPFLLMYNFAVMLDNRKSYKDQLISNGALMLSFFLLFFLFFYHFILGSFAALGDGTMNFMDAAMRMYRSISANGFFCFNIFVDLFLCSLFMFFINYRPSRYFQGKKLIIFRLMAVLPIGYEVGSMILKWNVSGGAMNLPFFVFPLLTVKPPMTFLVFMILTVFVKRRERKFIKHGGTYEDYQVFLQTNRNSFSFSFFAAIILFVAGLLDLVLTVMIPVLQSMASADQDAALQASLRQMLAIGMGGSVQLTLLAPFMLLFSYTRKRSNPKLDVLIPVFAVVLIVLVYFQSFYQIMHVLPISGKINFQDFFRTAEDLKDQLPLILTTMQ
jgi:uncharacterized membrane protein